MKNAGTDTCSAEAVSIGDLKQVQAKFCAMEIERIYLCDQQFAEAIGDPKFGRLLGTSPDRRIT